MHRISHDLPGVTQRLAKLADEFEEQMKETLEHWRDDKGRAFMQKHTSEVRPCIGQVVAEMTQTVELFEQIASRLRDRDRE